MPCARITSASCLRRPRIPPCTRGCSVFTRPSIISGKPVYSATSRARIPAAASAWNVLPVERISAPASASATATALRPLLSETLMSARRIGRLASCPSPPPPRSAVKKSVLEHSVGLQLFSQRSSVQSEHVRGARLVARDVRHHALEHRTFHLAQHERVKAGVGLTFVVAQ